MKREVDNRNKDCEFHGDYVGRDNITVNITMFRDSEREFVVTHNANIKPVSYFTGRETELQELRQRVEEGRKSVLVSGMGGIGKTHICRKLFEEYIQKHADGKNIPFCHIGYIEYGGDMSGSLTNCLKYRQQDSPEQNQEAAWRELEYLAADGKLLLFVDNVNVPVGEDAGLERLKQIPGAVVVTSRRTSFSKEFEPCRIGFLSTEQCIEIYERIRYEDSGKKVSEEEIPDLEYVIDVLAAGHTITIEFLAHLARTNDWSVKKLREELKKNGFQLKYMDEEDKLVNIQKSYETLYDMSILTEAEQNILEAFSVFPYIPLKAEICNQWLLADAGVDEEDYALMKLYQKGWLQFDVEQESYSMHPVFAQFIYEKCKPKIENHKELIEACQKSIEIPENGFLIEAQKYILFAENIAENIILRKGIKEILEQGVFIYALAQLYQQVADYKKAEKYYLISLQIFKDILEGENHFFIADIYNDLACTYFLQGIYEKAEELYKYSLSITKEKKVVARCYSNLANVYKTQGIYKKAIKFYKMSLLIWKDVFGENSSDSARCYNNLANMYVKIGDYEKAKVFYEKVMDIFHNIKKEDDLDTAMLYHDLAEMYARQRDYDISEKNFLKSIKIINDMTMDTHIDIATNYHDLAVMYVRKGDCEKAEKFIKKSLQIREKILGKNHTETANSYNTLGLVYIAKKEEQTALFFFLKAFKIWVSMHGSSSLNIKIAFDNMKLAYYAWNSQGNFEQWLEEKMKE